MKNSLLVIFDETPFTTTHVQYMYNILYLQVIDFRVEIINIVVCTPDNIRRFSWVLVIEYNLP